MNEQTDILIVGAGIVGAACAMELAEAGERVTLVDAAFPGAGATAECMGHIVVLDDSEAQIALAAWSRRLWSELADAAPPRVERDPCGTIWVAADDEEMAEVERKRAFYESRGAACETLDAAGLCAREPNLRGGLAGGLFVPGDVVVYAPCAAEWFVERAVATGRCEFHKGARVVALEPDGVARVERLGGESGVISAERIVVAAGVAARRLVPELAIRPRKGHLAITDRYPGFATSQLIELGYLKSAHGSDADSVAFNIQPRATGQMLIGSSRQFGVEDRAVDAPMVSRMLARAAEYMPGVRDLNVIRVWTGFRPATDDNLPLIGRKRAGTGARLGAAQLWIAAGHEGLGITTSLATARLIKQLMREEETTIVPEPFHPDR